MFKTTSNIIVILLLSTLLFSCKTKNQLETWEGLGEGDGYLEIRDSILTFNINEHTPTVFRISAIKNDSIFCSHYDNETGENKYAFRFHHSNQFDTITARIRNYNYHFKRLNKSEETPHEVSKIKLSIYDYDEKLANQITIDKHGLHSKQDRDGKLQSSQLNNTSTLKIFAKTSRLDLSNFIDAEKSFLMISHADCYCLEIIYDKDTKLNYCRQKHNNYIQSIIQDLRDL